MDVSSKAFATATLLEQARLAASNLYPKLLSLCSSVQSSSHDVEELAITIAKFPSRFEDFEFAIRQNHFIHRPEMYENVKTIVERCQDIFGILSKKVEAIEKQGVAEKIDIGVLCNGADGAHDTKLVAKLESFWSALGMLLQVVHHTRSITSAIDGWEIMNNRC